MMCSVGLPRGNSVQGEIPQLTSLPKPWGPKPFEGDESDGSHKPAAAFALKSLVIP